MKIFKLKLQFHESTTKVESQLDDMGKHFKIECKLSVVEAYQPNFHESIYTALRLSNTLLIYNKKPILFQFM
jgi:hypothetical protein